MRRAVSEEEKGLRRAGILTAAESVFALDGFHAATIASVARRAELSYGAVYWYFDSKDELFHAVLESIAADLRRFVAAGLDGPAAVAPPSPDELAPFRAAVTRAFEFFDSRPDAARLLFVEALALGETFADHVVAIQADFLQDIESTIRSLRADRSDAVGAGAPPRLVAFAVGALIGQMAHRRVTTTDGLSAAEAAYFAIDLLARGIGSGPATRIEDQAIR